MKIFIANVPHKMEDAELKQLLTQYGQVSSVKLLIDSETGKRKGFGFIEMPVYDQAKSALKGLNGKEMYGRKIALSEAENKEAGSSAADRFSPPKRKFNRGNTSEEIDGNRW
jgi:RNA recognition motif-containing protein